MDRTRTVNARTRGFLSDGRKEDDGADKSAANLTRPPFCLVIESWLGVWLLDGLPGSRPHAVEFMVKYTA